MNPKNTTTVSQTHHPDTTRLLWVSTSREDLSHTQLPHVANSHPRALLRSLRRRKLLRAFIIISHMATVRNRSRGSTNRGFAIKLHPRVTEPPEVLSRTPVTADTVPTGFTPGSSWSSSVSGAHGPSDSFRARYSNVQLANRSQTPSFLKPCDCFPVSGTPLTTQANTDASPVACYNGTGQELAASRVMLNLYLGGEQDTFNPALLKAHNIHFILNVAAECLPSRELYNQCSFVGPFTPGIEGDDVMTPSSMAMHSPDMTDGDMELVGCGAPQRAVTSTFPCVTAMPSSTIEGDHAFTYMYIPLKDTVDSGISAYFEDGAKFIRSALEQGKGILVHCRVGVSRSSTMVIAYIMQYGLNLRKPCKTRFEIALDRVKLVRPSINPNIGFGMALRLLDQQHQFRTQLWEEEDTKSTGHAIGAPTGRVECQ